MTQVVIENNSLNDSINGAVYKTGDFFLVSPIDDSYERDLQILAQIDSGKMHLICVQSGNRLMQDPIVSRASEVTQSEIDSYLQGYYKAIPVKDVKISYSV